MVLSKERGDSVISKQFWDLVMELFTWNFQYGLALWFCGPKKKACPSYTWCVSNKEANRLMHASNGNMEEENYSPTRDAEEEEEELEEPLAERPDRPARSLRHRLGRSNFNSTDMLQHLKQLQDDHERSMKAQEKKWEGLLKKLEENHEETLAQREDEHNKQAHAFQQQITDLSSLLTNFIDSQKKEAAKPEARRRDSPARTYRIGTHVIDVDQLQKTIDENNRAAYLNLIGREGLWVLLQSLSDEVPDFVQRRGDLDNAAKWTDIEIDQIDNLLVVFKVPLKNTDELHVDFQAAEYAL